MDGCLGGLATLANPFHWPLTQSPLFSFLSLPTSTEEVMSIKRLPEEAATQIQASGRLRSLNSVICGLVKNSLDAGASQIQIHVWYRRRRCEVDDNGLGIPPSEFREEEGLLFPNCMYQRRVRTLIGRHFRLTPEQRPRSTPPVKIYTAKTANSCLPCLVSRY